MHFQSQYTYNSLAKSSGAYFHPGNTSDQEGFARMRTQQTHMQILNLHWCNASEFRGLNPYLYQHWMMICQSLCVNHRTLLLHIRCFFFLNPKLRGPDTT